MRHRAAVADLLRREPRAATCSPAPSQAEFNYQTPGRDRPVHPLQGQGRRQAVELRAPRRVRAALRQPRPADLGPDQLRHQDAHGARHPRPRREAGAVPAVRRRPVPGRARQPHAVGHGRLHDDRPCTRTRRRSSGEGGLAGVVQLRAQLGEGRRSTPTRARSRSTCSTRRTRSSRPGAKAFPDLFTDGSRHVGGAPGAPALPRRPLQGAGDHVRPLPRHRAASASTTAARSGWCRPTPARAACRAT